MSKNINLDLATGVGLGLLMLAMLGWMLCCPEVSHGPSTDSKLQTAAHLACARFIAERRVGTETTFALVRGAYPVAVRMDWEEWSEPHPVFCSKEQTAKCMVAVRKRKLRSCTYGE